MPTEQTGREFLSANIQPSTLDAETRTVDAIWYSGADVDRQTWEGSYLLKFDPSGADLSRLNNGAPVLSAHNEMNQIGRVEKAWTEGGKYLARLRFSKRSEVDGIWQDVADRIITKLSMGVSLLATKDNRDKDGRLKARMVTKWEPFELSLVSIPADNATTTLSNSERALINARERQSMNEQTTTNPGSDPVIAERTRVSAILKRAKVCNLSQEFAQGLIDEGISVEAAATRMIDEQARLSSQYPQIRHAHVTRDYREGLATRMAESVVFRAIGGTEPSEGARQFMGASLVDLARECLAAAGNSVGFTRSHSEIVRMALHTTGDFPALLTESGQRMLMRAYEAASPQIKQVSRRTTAADFRLKNTLRLSEMPALLEVAEHGEVTRGSRAESKETYRLRRFARIFGLTRQAIINDDLNAFANAATEFGTAAATLEGKQIADLLISNPTMSDSVVLFHDTHKNLSTGAGSALGVPGLSAARLLLRKTLGMDGATVLDIPAAILLVPAALETTGQQTLSAIYPTATTGANPFAGALTLAVDPRLDADSEAAWFLFADPNGPNAVLEHAYLAGAEGVSVETRVGFDVEGLEIKAGLDFGAGVVGFRGAVKSAGS